jgi:hypothetical protein
MANSNIAFVGAEDIKNLPRFPQSQRALNDQLRDLAMVANRLGLYDAADHINRNLGDR